MVAAGLPVVLLLEGAPCLVVGGGPVAQRKAAALLEAGAEVTVVAPAITPELAGWPVRTVRRRYERRDLDGQRVVMTATGDPAVDGAVYADAHAAGVLVNAADDPSHCDFTLPAVVRCGPVSVAVATDGASPALAGWLRTYLAEALPADLEAITAAVSRARGAVRAAGHSSEGLAWLELIESVRAGLAVSPEVAEATVDAFIAGVLEGGGK